MIDELLLLVHQLAPGVEGLEPFALLPRPPEQRRQFPWDLPAAERLALPAETNLAP